MGCHATHNYYTQLFAAFQDGANCFGDLMSPGSYSTDCRTDIDLDVRNYGCCVNVPINYFAANDTASGINQAADTLFINCRVQRPLNCTSSPLPVQSTTSPPFTTRPSDSTTGPPDTTTRSPDTTTRPPDTTTRPPDTTTRSPDTTTSPPDTTTSPPDTTTRPPDTTTRPPDTTTRPPGSTNRPQVNPPGSGAGQSIAAAAILAIAPLIGNAVPIHL